MSETRSTDRTQDAASAAAPPLVATDVRQPLGRFVWHQLRVGVPLCGGLALFLSLAFGGRFVPTLVYSLCIGLSIQSLIEGGRYALAAWQRHRRPNRDGATGNWPGWAWMAPWVVFSTVAGYGLGSLAGDWFYGAGRTFTAARGDPHGLAVVVLISLIVALIVTYIFYTRGRLAASQAQAEAARRAAVENQLLLLQSQLEPHMLFNTLANLRVLIAIDPDGAQRMLDHLIGFLRATLVASRASVHPLASEFDRLADYLALMTVRMGARLEVRFDLPQELRALAVPALLLQPLVENCIKHGLEPKVDGGRIEISARRDADRLALTVRDTGVGLGAAADRPPTASSGYGLLHVRERLQALYGGRASFSLASADDGQGGTVARLALPLQAMIRPS
jgi:hypothetical protein